MSSTKNGKIVECYTCHRGFYAPKHRLERNRRLFCSKKCMYEGLKIISICNTCGKTFWRRTKGKVKYCSKKCAGIGRRKGTFIKCEVCNKEVYKPKSFLNHNNHFCSVKCTVEFQKRNKLVFICKICGSKFEWSKSRIKDNNPTYCSIKCRNKDPEWIKNACIQGNLIQQNKKGLNKLEIDGRKILESLGLRKDIDFKEQILMFDRFLVDILISNKKLIIQWDGIYWHSKTKRTNLDVSQDAYFKKCGYDVLRISDNDIKHDKNKVIENIRNKMGLT